MRFKEIFTDPSSGQYSCSRVGLFAMNVLAIFAVGWMLWTAKAVAAATVVTGVAATDATVYFRSTGKEAQ